MSRERGRDMLRCTDCSYWEGKSSNFYGTCTNKACQEHSFRTSGIHECSLGHEDSFGRFKEGGADSAEGNLEGPEAMKDE